MSSKRRAYKQYETNPDAKIPRQTRCNWRRRNKQASSSAAETPSPTKLKDFACVSITINSDVLTSGQAQAGVDVQGTATTSRSSTSGADIINSAQSEERQKTDEYSGLDGGGGSGDDENSQQYFNPDGEGDSNDEHLGDPREAADEEDPEEDPEEEPADQREEDPEVDPEDPEVDPEDPEVDPEDPEVDPEDPDIVDENINQDQALIMILTYVLRHNLTGEALQDLLTMINQFVPGLSPATKFLFKKYFNDANGQIEIHYYCKSCTTYIGQDENVVTCVNEACGDEFDASINRKNGCFLLYIPIKSQLIDLFGRKDIASARIEKVRRENDTLGDIFDGSCMQKLLEEGKLHPDDFTLLWNCDGVPVFKSSDFSIWPIQVVVNELPPKVRRKNVLFCGLWFGPNKPTMSTFLTPFVTEAENLADEGFDWVDPNTAEQKHSRAFFLTAACDSVARPVMRNCLQFNGRYGCDWCLHPGEVVDKGAGTVRCFPYADPEPPLRSQEQWEEDVPQASPENTVRGVKGPSLLLFLPLFNIITGFVPDYMHSVLLGVVRQFVKLWFDSRYHNKEWYLGTRSQEFDQSFLKMKPPRELSRAPRSITTKAYWKASEWKSFLLYFPPFVLHELLPAQYFKHWCLLVFGIHMLLQNRVSMRMIDQSELALKKFVIGVGSLYGEEHVSFNVHLLTHLPASVRSWGPLWAASAFSFEANNGKLLKFFHGSQYVPQQISKTFLLWRSIPKFLYALHDAPLSVKSYVERLWMCSGTLPKSAVKFGRSVLLGIHVEQQIPLRILTAIRRLLGNDFANRTGLFYKRILIEGSMYCCRCYTRSNRRIDYGVQFSDGSFGMLDHVVLCKLHCNCAANVFCQCQQSIIIVCTSLVTQNTHVFQDGQIHINSSGLIHEVRPGLQTKCVFPTNVRRKCVVINDGRNIFISPLCNILECD